MFDRPGNHSRPFALIFLLIGCWSEKEIIQKFAPKEDDEFARRFIELLREHYEEADPMLDSAVAARTGSTGLKQMHQMLDHGQVLEFELIGANQTFFRPWDGSGTKRQTNLTYQLRFHDAWLVAAVVVESGPKGRHILGVNFRPTPDSLQVINGFTLKNKSIVHYLFLAACILVPLFIVTTIVICARTRVRRRWLWIIFIVIGLVQFKLNWTTGALGVQPISFNILGAGWWRASSYAPLILTFALPVGAIIFLIFRPWLRPGPEPPPLPPAENAREGSVSGN